MTHFEYVPEHKCFMVSTFLSLISSGSLNGGEGGGVGNLTKKVKAENFKGPVIGHINGLVILIWLSDNRLTEL